MRVLWAILVALFLSACTGGVTPVMPPTDATLAHPPWEALVRAGPDAHKDIDYETLDGEKIATAQPRELVPEPNIEVADITDDPAASAERPEQEQVAAQDPAREGEIKAVAVLPVTGAGSPGDRELTDAMRGYLSDAGLPVITKRRKDALIIAGTVRRRPAGPGMETVELAWLVTTPDGRVLGDVKQANDVPKGSLDKGWGVNAEAASQAAAEGIAKLVKNYR